LLVNRGIHRLFIGFNSGEIRTNSVFDPLREETHAAERLLEPGDIERHVPQPGDEEKIAGMWERYRARSESRSFESVPETIGIFCSKILQCECGCGLAGPRPALNSDTKC